MDQRPVIGITLGDPSGIGPEIILKALSDAGIYEMCRPVVIGDSGALSSAWTGSEKAPIRDIGTLEQARGKSGQIDLLPLSGLNGRDMIPGKPTVEGGKAMVAYIRRAVELALQGEIGAMVTCPISKILMQQAGCPFEGHTQFIAHLTNTSDYIMMLAGDRLRVSLVTIHCALKDVPDCLDQTGVYKTIVITSEALRRDFGLNAPRIAVAALNPHAGESGLFGKEEEEIIKPALKRAEDEGFHTEGPFPPDTLFHKAAVGGFDAVVAMYHDQGLIPLKLLHFSDAVNVTLGLPIIRTSVDHGTAYDIAGKGIADPSSLKAAIRMAVMMVENRRKVKNSVTF